MSLSIYITADGPNPDLAAYADLLRSLLRDLENLARRQLPDPAVLEHAPILHRWKLDQARQPGFDGVVHGKRLALTGLCIFAPRFGYARTWAGLYALGTPRHGNS